MGHNKILYLLLLYFLVATTAKAQCIAVFPYTENFNGNTTQWFSGGINSDWLRVVAAKSYITSTTKCWVTAGNATSYNNNQRSYVESPCFDFTNVTYPYIQFDYNYECHQSEDGATLQYSINGGPWTNVGSINDPTNCINENWFNATNIANLNTLATVKEGWSGTIRPATGVCVVGNGTAGWKTAKKTMLNLAGVANVKFRFAFGSGPACTTFDGFAFDNIYIGEAPSNFASFVSACASGLPLTYNFINNSSLCPTTFSWDFGEPSSGINNTSALMNPQHTYAAPGTYTVTLTVSGLGNAPSTYTKVITTVDAGAVIVPPSCTGDNNGTMTINSINMYSPQAHTIVSTGQIINTPPYTFTGLAAGTYTVSSQGADNCALVKVFTIVDPPVLDITNVSIVKPNCINNSGGKISVFATGGTGAYTITGGGLSTNTSTLQPLSSGVYTVTLKDAKGCTETSVVDLPQEGAPTINQIDVLGIRCHDGEDGKITVLASCIPTTTITNYSIVPSALQIGTGIFGGMSPGNYTVTVQDAQGCTATSIVTMDNPTKMKLESPRQLYLVCKPELDSLWVYASGGTEPYEYTLQPLARKSSTGLFEIVPMGNYLVQARDNNSCLAELPVKVDEGDCCSDVFIPTAFTPNGDGINELFNMKIFGTVLINKFQILNRYGEIVFDKRSTQGWDGYHRGLPAPADTYYYVISYSCRNGKSFTRMGEVILMR